MFPSEAGRDGADTLHQVWSTRLAVRDMVWPNRWRQLRRRPNVAALEQLVTAAAVFVGVNELRATPTASRPRLGPYG
jgi:hypothetical protein